MLRHISKQYKDHLTGEVLLTVEPSRLRKTLLKLSPLLWVTVILMTVMLIVMYGVDGIGNSILGIACVMLMSVSNFGYSYSIVLTDKGIYYTLPRFKKQSKLVTWDQVKAFKDVNRRAIEFTLKGNEEKKKVYLIVESSEEDKEKVLDLIKENMKKNK